MKFLDELEKVLSTDGRFIGEDNEVIKTKVSDAARSNDKNLLKVLLENDLLKKAFFTRVDDIYVFDKNKFIWVLESKEFLPDSYTMYKKTIGLVDANNNLISNQGDISLVWPYKDCVLEGGQTKEDQKRDEIFYNETLAPDQVNRLLAPKVLGNAKRYTKNGIEEDIEFKDDDNLIIKGNNLLALSSLLEKYEGKVKCIYIDPPYNTNEDSFHYNDNFNVPTWLTFILNRLKIAKKLLKENGIIIIQISFHQYAPLKLLLNDLFKDGKTLMDFNVLVRHPERSLTTDKEFNDVIEYALCYSKSRNYIMPKKIKPKTNEEYIYDIKLPLKSREIIEMDNKLVNVYFPEDVKIIKSEGHETGLKSMSIRGTIREKNSSGRFYVKHIEKLIGKYPKGTMFAVPNMGDDIHEFRIFELPTGNNVNGKYYPGKPISSDITLIPYPNFLDYVEDYNNVNSEGGISFRNGKKPESYIKNYIDMFTNEDDIVLDFFMGSATTQAVAMKMNRQFIGVEQMDYINTVSVPRLQKVIAGEQGGISKSVNWQGGGSFVYCELLEDNENLVTELERAEDTDQIKIVLNKAIDNGKLIPSVLPSDLKDTEEGFEKLSLEDQKNLVMELLNKNKLYVNLSDIDDENYKVSETDKAFTRSFYGKE